MKLASLQTLAVLLIVLVCVHEVYSWPRIRIRTRWLRRVRDWACKNICRRICSAGKCHWSCKLACGRKRRDLSERSFENNGGQVMPVELDFNAWIAKCGAEPGSNFMNYACFLKANGDEDTTENKAAFDAADSDGDGKISRQEFRDAPFLFEGEEPEAPLGLQIAAAMARGDVDGGGSDNGQGGENNGQGGENNGQGGENNGQGGENNGQGGENADDNGVDNGGDNNGQGQGPSKRTMDRLEELKDLLNELEE